MTERLKYTFKETDRHGKVRHYFRRRQGSARVALPGEPGSAGYLAAYRDALAGCAERESRPVATSPPKVSTGTLRWLCTQYFVSKEFTRLDDRTQRVRRQIIEHCLRAPIAPGAKEVFADFPLHRVTQKAIRTLRDLKADFPEAGNNRVKAFRQVFRWALEHEIDGVENNPARDVAYFERHGDGFHAWTLEEVEKFEARHPIGTKARLALALFLYTGQRRSDVVTFGRQHVKNGWLCFTQFKGRKRHPNSLEIPMMADLKDIIAASPTGDLTYLVTEYGRPFTSNGFGNWFRTRCDEAGLPQCSAHGLRKAAAARLAEAGCTTHEIMAITGHRTIGEVERYTRGVRQKALASAAVAKVTSIKA